MAYDVLAQVDRRDGAYLRWRRDVEMPGKIKMKSMFLALAELTVRVHDPLRPSASTSAEVLWAGARNIRGRAVLGSF